MNSSISVENLSKAYQLGSFNTGTLSKDIERWWTLFRGKEDPYLKIGEENDRRINSNSNIVWSLKDINFDIPKGEVFGIIGRNGAGKSTLLKVLSQVTNPTSGKIKLKGRVASLLEVGTGFHPELTGRENIYLNGAILGMRKTEIKSKFDEIVEFSGVEKYIDTPVKRYSSGMYVRLAFAVAAHLESEILIVDEVLAVGDAEFQKKCIGKMQDTSKNSGRTILFVSHNMGAIQSLCNKGIYLKNGGLVYQGEINDTINMYMQDIKIKDGQDLSKRTDRQGNKSTQVQSITFFDKNNTIVNDVIAGQYLKISFELSNVQNIDTSKLIIAIKILDPYEQDVVFWVSDELNHNFSNLLKNTFSIEIPSLNLRPGEYNIAFQISLNDTNSSSFCDVMSNASSINVLSSDFFNSGTLIRSSYTPLIQAIFLNK